MKNALFTAFRILIFLILAGKVLNWFFYAVVGVPHSFCLEAAPTTELRPQSIPCVSHPKPSMPVL